jgi:crotonobetainyl-CoA:carnitine CoA-transferase CaiB-like acyl-CoA transferase
MKQHPTVWWIDKLEALSIGCGPINKLSEVFADPHVLAREMVLEMEHATGGSMKMIANPVKLSETPADYRLPPPVLGQHTDQVLSSRLGMNAASLAALREKGII